MISSLKYYYREVERLRKIGKEWNLTDEDIDRIIDDSFQFLEEHSSQIKESKSECCVKWPKAVSKLLFSLFVVLVLCYVLYAYRKVAHNYVERNIQEIIYPGMKLIRKVMLPVIRTFPSLTEWYDEACLLGNPYFHVSDIDCWPCEGVRSILNLTASNLSSDQYHSGIPFIFRDSKMKKVTFNFLVDLYKEKQSIFDKDAPRVEDSRSGVNTAHEVFSTKPLNNNPSPSSDTHITWKLNRLEPTRSVRKLFGIPEQVPSYISGATPEKFVLIDEPNSPPYQLPGTEGTTVFVVQGAGSRLFILNPSTECQSSCHRVSIVLHPHHILWYNWWYWRGVSVPLSNSVGISVTYMGSYY